MPVLAPQQPTLHKAKSKLRLRLGLTPPHPKAPVRSKQNTYHLSAIDDNLASSTSTTNSSISRTDSRTAFTYDSSTPSPPDQRPDFDTISYHTQSPESIALLTEGHSSYVINQSASTLFSSETDTSLDTLAYPTPSPSASPELIHDLYVPSQLPPQADLVLDDTPHPNITAATLEADNIFSLTDQQLSDRFTFISEIGFGNWGCVWLCKPRQVRSSRLSEDTTAAVMKLGKKAAASGGGGASGRVAIKLVHRSKNADTAARVRALWGEMKIIRSLRHEPHPSIIQFEAFVICPSYAIVIMPYLPRLIPVCLSVATATPYFRQLASAVGYLHERGITHNDIKPANVMLSHNDVPVLVDFGFAQKWEVGARGSFLSSISWGTPEYLEPQRARGLPHDERASDVWSLGITLFEILIGRTPFEEDDREEFYTEEELLVYYERTRRGEWIGAWSMPDNMQDLLRRMISPDPSYRLTAMQAYHHPALQPSAPSVIITPHFVRAAACFDDEEPLPAASDNYVGQGAAQAIKKDQVRDKKKRQVKKVEGAKGGSLYHQRATTPTALGESIKQHTSVSKPKKPNGDDKENQSHRSSPNKGSKLVIKKTRQEELEDKYIEEDPTPTKIIKPAQPLRINQLSHCDDKKLVPRTSDSQISSLSRPTSTATLKDTTNAAVDALSYATSTSTLKDKRVSVLSSTSTVPKNKDEAVLKTMRSLEGTRKPRALVHAPKDKAQEALAAVKRPAPSPPRPKSLDSAVEVKDKKEEARRSLGLERAVLVEVQEEEVDVKVIEGKTEIETVVHLPQHSPTRNIRPGPVSPPRAQVSDAQRMPTPSPQKVRRKGPAPHASLDPVTGRVFPASDDESPLAELREKILVTDQEMAVRFRQISGGLADPPYKSQSIDLPSASAPPASAAKQASSTGEFRSSSANGQTAVPELAQRKSVEVLALDSRLDKMSAWIKGVEVIIQDARIALAEGREPGLPVLRLPMEITGEAQEHRFGVTPDKAVPIPAHLRTSSTQVEPATPPKWMTYAEAEEKVKAANAWMEEQGRKGKRDRPTVGHVLKLFASDKEKEKTTSRSATPDFVNHVPLKPPANDVQSHTLRGAPSTPALRSSTTPAARVPLRKSESNLRNFNTMPVIPSPSLVAGPEYSPDLLADQIEDEDILEHVISPRKVRYENMLSTEPGFVRQGDGWGSLSSGRAMMKPSSMASLREKAKAFLSDTRESRERHIVDLSQEVHKLEKRTSKLGLNNGNGAKTGPDQLPRPNTPVAGSVLTANRHTDGGKVKGWVKSLIGKK